MKKIFNKIALIFTVMLFLLASSVFALDIKWEEAEYTEAYKRYLELSDEEKSKVLEPRKYNISSEENSTRETLLKNKKITFNNWMKLLKASTYAEQTNFTLQTLIPNNLKIRNQMQTNICWTFAGLSSLETNLALKNFNNQAQEKIYDYSERHMAYSKTQGFKNGQNNKYGFASVKVKDGGNMLMAISYLVNGQGAVNEEDMPFENNEEDIDISLMQNKEVQTTVNDIIYFDSVEKPIKDDPKLTELQQQMKEHISTYGSIDASIYSPDGSKGSAKYINEENGALYTDEITTWKGDDGVSNCSSAINHAISIVGWDDDYDKTKFTTQPPDNGAWIIRNSWGEKEEYTFDELKLVLKEKLGKDASEEEFEAFLEKVKELGYTVDKVQSKISKKCGNDGFYYVSYYDVNIYTNMMGIVSADDTKTYDNIYQLDEVGASLPYEIKNEQLQNKDVYIANVFKRTKTNNEYLTSIGLTSLVSGTYEVYVNPNGTDKSKANLQKVNLVEGQEITLTAGYNTIDFAEKIELTGTDFVVVLKVKNTGGEALYITAESSKVDSNCISNAGESFFTIEGFNNDTDWVDAGDNSQNNAIGNWTIKGITEDVKEDPKEEPTIKTSNSDFKKAKVTVKDVTFNTDAEEFKAILIVEGIEVKEPNDSYKHYFYISSDPNKTEDNITDWTEVEDGNFVKQDDGTYNLTLTIDDINELKGIGEGDGDRIYVYIKEVATKDTKTSTLVTGPIELIMDTEEVKEKEEEKGTEEATKQSNYIIDKTVATSALPNTGLKTILIIGTILLVICIISYIRTKNMKDIK